MHPEASGALTLAFVILPLAVLLAAIVGVCVSQRRAGADSKRVRRCGAIATLLASLWLGIPAWMAFRGVFVFEPVPPPALLVVGGFAATVVLLAFSRFGTALANHVSFAWLVGTQAFRLPLELAMHHAADVGVMPDQMSYSGYNFDIVTGLTAAGLGLFMIRREVPRWVVLAWNVMGAALLVTIVTIAIASSPLFAAFGPHRLNTFVTYWPFCWLATVLVPAALLGHLLVARKLAMTRNLGLHRIA